MDRVVNSPNLEKSLFFAEQKQDFAWQVFLLA